MPPRDTPSRSTALRTAQFVAVWIGIVLVFVFGPRMDGPRVWCGVTLRTKTGGDGLSDLGLGLLVLAPVVAWVLTGIVGRAILRRRRVIERG